MTSISDIIELETSEPSQTVPPASATPPFEEVTAEEVDLITSLAEAEQIISNAKSDMEKISTPGVLAEEILLASAATKDEEPTTKPETETKTAIKSSTTTNSSEVSVNKSSKDDDTKLALAKAAKTLDCDDDDDDDEDLDETLVERILGLSEMFPVALRSTTSGAINNSISLVKSAYSLSRQIVWVTISTSVIMFAPVVFEIQRLNLQEDMKQSSNRLVFGPGAAMAGSPVTPGMVPLPSPSE